METLFLRKPGGTIAYDESQGTGPPVMMWPGIGALRSEYRYLAPVLKEAGYRVITADLRGHGESSAHWSEYSVAAAGQDILDLIEYIGAGPANVIGNSFSPGAAVWAAAETPGAFRSLVLIGAFVRETKASFLQKLMTAVLFAGPWRYSGWISFYKTLYPTQRPADFDSYLSDLKANLQEPGRFEALKSMASAPKADSENNLAKVKTPALVVMGTKDPDWPDPTAEARFIKESISAELAMIEDAGHYPQSEMPEKVNPVILDFLSRVNMSSQG